MTYLHPKEAHVYRVEKLAGSETGGHGASAAWRRWWAWRRAVNERAATAVGAALLLLVVVVHFRYHDIAALLYPQRAEYASRALFYVLRGVSGALVFAALMMLAAPAILLRVACCVGMFAEGATAFCRASYPLDQPLPVGANVGGLCDAATREPITAMLAGGVAVSLLWMGRQRGAR